LYGFKLKRMSFDTLKAWKCFVCVWHVYVYLCRFIFCKNSM
jgi:hypothetical protein